MILEELLHPDALRQHVTAHPGHQLVQVDVEQMRWEVRCRSGSGVVGLGLCHLVDDRGHVLVVHDLAEERVVDVAVDAVLELGAEEGELLVGGHEVEGGEHAAELDLGDVAREGRAPVEVLR